MLNTKRAVISDIEAMKSMKEFIIAHEEIAANNMRRIRDAVVKRRDFLAELTQLYNEVKRCYKKEYEALLAKSKNKKDPGLNVFKKKKKTACVLFSTNTSFYGDIVRNTYALFSDYIKKEDCDVVIVGKVGKRVYEEDNPGAVCAYFDFPDRSMDNELLKAIVMDIIQYEKVVVFHSKFQTLLVQTPMAVVISENQSEEAGAEGQIKYIFEPSLEKIVEYFEKEIFSSIFEQTMQESHLSKFASRMVSLDSASENIKRRLVDLKFKKRIIQHQLINKDQLNTIARIVMAKRVVV